MIQLRDTVAAKNLIEYFHERLDTRQPLNERVLFEYLRFAFVNIVEKSWPGDTALGLKIEKGHYPRPQSLFRDLAAPGYIVLLMRKGWLWLDAIGEVANILFPDGTGDKAVTAACAKYKETLQELPDNELVELLPECTPAISGDMTG